MKLKEAFMEYLENAVEAIASGEVDADDVVQELVDLGMASSVAQDMVYTAIESSTQVLQKQYTFLCDYYVQKIEDLV